MVVMQNLDLKWVINNSDSVSEYTARVWSISINRAMSARRSTSSVLKPKSQLWCVIYIYTYIYIKYEGNPVNPKSHISFDFDQVPNWI